MKRTSRKWEGENKIREERHKKPKYRKPKDHLLNMPRHGYVYVLMDGCKSQDFDFGSAAKSRRFGCPENALCDHWGPLDTGKDEGSFGISWTHEGRYGIDSSINTWCVWRTSSQFISKQRRRRRRRRGRGGEEGEREREIKGEGNQKRGGPEIRL